MSRREAVLLASRTLALLLTVWALTDVSYLPDALYSFLRYNSQAVTLSSTEYWRHYHLIHLGFIVTRIIGYSLTSVWLFKAGAEVEELLLPGTETHPVGN